MLAAEVVEGDVLCWYAEVVEHVGYGAVHHWGAAKVVLDVFRRVVLAKVVVEQGFVDEAGESGPVVFWFCFA